MVRGHEHDQPTPERQKLVEAEKLGACFPDKFLALTEDQKEEYFSTRARLLEGTEPENQDAHFAFLAGALSHSDVFAQSVTDILRHGLHEINIAERAYVRPYLDNEFDPDKELPSEEEQAKRTILEEIGDLRYIKRLIVDPPTGRFFQRKGGFDGEAQGTFYGRTGNDDTILSLIHAVSYLFKKNPSLYDPNDMTGEFFDLVLVIDEHVQPFPRIKLIDKWTEEPRVKRAYQLLEYRLGMMIRQGTNDKTLLISEFSVKDEDVVRYEDVRGRDGVVETVDAILSDPEVNILGNFADLLESKHDKPVKYWQADSREEALPKYEDTCGRIRSFAGWDDETKRALIGELSKGLLREFDHERDVGSGITSYRVAQDAKYIRLIATLRDRAIDVPDRKNPLWFSMFNDRIGNLAHFYRQNPPVKKEEK